MDRYVLVVLFNVEPKKPISFSGIEAARKIHDKLKEFSNSTRTNGISPFPACSVSGSPGSQKWYFAIQASCAPVQYCSSEWEEVCVQRSDGEEPMVSAVDSCVSCVQEQEHSQESESPSHAELLEDAAEALHQLADKLPPPGRFLLDVIMLCVDEVGLKDFLPVIGSLKHMQVWHSAQITIITEHTAGWQMAASYLSGQMCSPSAVEDCIDKQELWRGGLLIRERKFASELLLAGFSLRAQARSDWSRSLDPGSDPRCNSDHTLQAETFHYYQPVLELIRVVRVTDIPVLLHSRTQFELTLSISSAKGHLLMDRLRALRGEVGALFCLSCVVSTEAFPPAPQLSTAKWRAFVAKNPKLLSAPDVEMKGEKGHYLLLVQGAETGGLKARLIHSASQINGAAALAVVNSLLLTRGKVPSSSGTSTADWLSSLPCLRGDQLLQRERKLASMQAQVLQECLRRRTKAQKPAAMPPSDLKALLNLAREQYLKMHSATLLPAPAPAPPGKENRSSVPADTQQASPSEGPERNVLRNYANMQKGRQRNRSSLLSINSVECLMGPKGSQRSSSALLDAREVLRHFTSDGLPSGELQPLPILRGENAFQLSHDLTPRKVTKLPFRQAASACYHGIEFCLDEQKALERDRDFARLQSRLIRFETQTTCCKEPWPVPLALSPAPSPAGPSETGSVPDGEAQPSELPSRKRRPHDLDARAHLHKRLATAESSESLGSQRRSGSRPVPTALRQHSSLSQSYSSPARHSSSRGGPEGAPRPAHSTTGGQKATSGQTESRSQKHNRMLKEVVVKTLKHYGITSQQECFDACVQRLFDVSKLYLKDLKTSRGLHEEMRKAACRNAQQVIDWVVEKASQK